MNLFESESCIRPGLLVTWGDGSPIGHVEKITGSTAAVKLRNTLVDVVGKEYQAGDIYNLPSGALRILS